MTRAGELLDRYGELVVRVGASVRPGQGVAINAHVEHAPLVRALARHAYRAGARFVDVWYWDARAKRSRLRHAPVDSLGETPAWLDVRAAALEAERGALISVRGEAEPGLLHDVDPERAGRDRMPSLPAHLALSMHNLVNWTVVACPTAGWARAVFGEPDLERLWEAVARAVRLDEPDPVEAWRRHVARLEARAEALNGRAFDALRFRGPGTDLVIGLIPGARWTGGRARTEEGHPYIPNLPTEEVFTTPDWRRTEGRARTTRDITHAGTVIRGLELVFRGGRIVDVRARSGEEIVRAELVLDDHCRFLGEVALVDGSSRVDALGVPMLDPLFDENATSHIAYGAGYPEAVPGAVQASESRRLELGVNVAPLHTDVMIGDREVEVDGLEAGGAAVPILRDGVWQLDGEGA